MTHSKETSAGELKALAYRLYRNDEMRGNGLWTGMPCEFDQMWPPHQERYLTEARALQR